MKRSLAFIFALVIIAAGLPALLFASSTGFILAAISPDKQKVSCIRSHESSILAALKNNGFAPKQDDTDFIYSLIGHDGPESADPTSQQNFWSFWTVESPASQLKFSGLGPAAIAPQDGHIYLFSFGNGSAPSLPATTQTICNDSPPPAPQPSPTTNLPAQTSSSQYLLDRYSTMTKADQDWAAMALGSNGINVAVSDTSSEAITSQARVALAKAAQGKSAVAEIGRIIASFDGNQIGSPALVNDDIFGVLALTAFDKAWLDARPQIHDFIAGTQRSNGSFGFAPTGDSDVDMTAAALWALRFSDEHAPEKSAARNYLTAAQNSDGGFGFQPGQASNIPSTAWATLGLRAVGASTASAENYLTANRQSDGSYLYAGQKSSLATSYALLALSGKQLPIIRITTQPPQITGNNKGNFPPTHSPSIFKKSKKPTSVTSETIITVHLCSASASAAASASGSSASASASAAVVCW